MQRKALGLTVLTSAALAVIVASSMSGAQDPAAQPTTSPAAATMPTTQPDPKLVGTVSYGFGYQIGQQFKGSPITLNAEEFRKGIEDAIAGVEMKVSPQDMQAAVMKLQDEEMTRMQAEAETAGKKFRDENAKKEGVKTTASGLQIQITQEGTGASPVASDTVKVHYTGTLIDGTKFDSSVDRGEPATFPLNGVIAGWTEGLQLMKTGGKARLVIPPNLGYGPQGSQGAIPPNATLVFEVELIEIVKPAGK